MSSNFYSVLDTPSVTKLKTHLKNNPDDISLTFQQLIESLDLTMVKTNYVVNLDIPLENPRGNTQELNADAKNCKIILNVLPSLTPANATDERLWITLCFSEFRDYVSLRWPLRESKEEKSSDIEAHWFVKGGVRGRMRDNAISRLWIMGNAANNIKQFTIDKVFDILFSDSDYRSSLLERSSTANSVNVITAILLITDEAYNNGITFKRPSFRNFIKEVNIIGGRSNLAAMKVEDIVNVLKPHYLKAYSE